MNVVADLPPDFLEHHQPETAAVLTRAAELVGAAVRVGRQELADQMAAGQHLDAVEPALRQRGRRAVSLDHAGDVVLVHLLGKAAVQRLADRRRRDGRQPVRGIGLAAPAQMRDLAHERGAMGVDALGETVAGVE